MVSLRLLLLAAAITALQGCVSSQTALLDSKSIIVDKSLTGRYLLPASQEQKPTQYDVYLKGKEYILVQASKIVFVGTLHRWHADTYLAQLRSPVDPADNMHPSRYAYMLVRKTEKDVALNLIQCSTAADFCNVSTGDELKQLAAEAEKNPQEKQLGTAAKIAELDQ